MTEQDFLLAIHENPDDDAPRLMFADWLSENGQDERAELVRVQCELDRLERRRKDWLTCPTCEERDGAIHAGECRYQALRERETVLLTQATERVHKAIKARETPETAATNSRRRELITRAWEQLRGP